MCTCVHILVKNGALSDICLMYCRICQMGPLALYSVLLVTQGLPVCGAPFEQNWLWYLIFQEIYCYHCLLKLFIQQWWHGTSLQTRLDENQGLILWFTNTMLMKLIGIRIAKYTRYTQKNCPSYHWDTIDRLHMQALRQNFGIDMKTVNMCVWLWRW